MTVMIGYTRRSKVNRKRPQDLALSIAAQRAAIAAEADRRGWDIIWTDPDDGWSGRNVVRPGLKAALEILKRGEADGIVVSKLSRLSRSVQDFTKLLKDARKQGWSIVALDLGVDTTTINGRLVVHILIAVAEWEGEIIGERTAEGLAALPKAQRDRLGRQQMIPPPVARRIRRYAADGLSCRAIATRLTASGTPSPTGRPSWSHSTVARYLARTPRRAA
jgi:DNA invertase Pin-like site-specific DNA recombinase